MRSALKFLALAVCASAQQFLSLLVSNSTGVMANISSVPFIGACGGAGGGMNAWQATLLAGATATDAINVQWKTYPGLGVFVTAINGIAGSDSAYWELSLNGKSAGVGAQDLPVAAGDVIGWTLAAGSARIL